MLPTFAFIVLVSMVKDAFEDFQKHQQDEHENRTEVTWFDRETNKFDTTHWSNLRPGDLIMLNNQEPVPADCIAVQCSDERGQLYVETKSLDGETNLKTKQVPKEIAEVIKFHEEKNL